MATSRRGKDKGEGQAGYCEGGEDALGTASVGSKVEVGLGSCRGGRKV
jgi:hypothetical protein